MSIVLFFIILAALVLVHELGHFWAAKKSGVRVDEFGLGFPPRLWGKRKGETLYSVNAIPFGGFVKIFGENGAEDGEIPPEEKARLFTEKPRWVQAIILVAGVAMNVVFAWLLFSIGFMSGMTTGVSEANERYVKDSHVIVLDALPGSPAEKAGLKEGDEILSFRTLALPGRPASTAGATTTAASVKSVQDVAKGGGGAPIVFEVQRLADIHYVTVTPEQRATGSTYAIGISMDLVGKVMLPVHTALWEGAKLTWYMFANIVTSMWNLIADALVGQADVSQLSGPVGIARLVGDARELGFAYLMSFTAFISLNLAVLNLVPFPALDGGRLVFVAIEAVTRRKIPAKVSNLLNVVGFGLLILFMLFITYRDIAKLF